ncbi:sugar pentulose and hexulose kinase [Nitzschia inconspicua]|uniref:Sugar pentulose and hexulose kinase n=1 Tax=Nitzschia inconspicua TaxID=303405 RepID=A0A9K3LVR5_9STRA|nr:sugar pentulose and hexulose kinase [Nitzschia inconspicua]
MTNESPSFLILEVETGDVSTTDYHLKNDMMNPQHKVEGQGQQPTDVILALDIGSSSIRCTAYETQRSDTSLAHDSSFSLKAVASCSKKRQSVVPNSGKIRIFQNDSSSFFDTIDELLEATTVKLRESLSFFQVVAVGFSTFVMNLVAVSTETGQPLGNDHTMSYACNAPKAVYECQRLKRDTDESRLQQLYQTTGAPLHTAYAIPQLRAMYHDEATSAYLNATDHTWQTLASHCIARWTLQNALPISYSEASWTGLLNINTCTFEPTALDLLPANARDSLPPLADFHDCGSGLPEYFPPINDSTGECNVNPYWDRFPELRQTKFYLGIGDGACANIGSKCTVADRIAVTIGTSAAARICIHHPIQQDSDRSSSPALFSFRIPDYQGLFCYRIDRNHILVGGALTDGGSVVEWARDFLNMTTDEVFEQCLQGMETLERQELDNFISSSRSNNSNSNNSSSGSHTTNTPLLLTVPFLSGERSTGFRDGATGVVLGLNRDTSSVAFFRSCIEGVSLRLKAILDLLVACNHQCCNDFDGKKELSCKPVIVASGKAMETNDFWRQMIADASGLSIIFDKETEEGTSRGVARLVVMALYDLTASTCREDLQIAKLSEPRPMATAMYSQKAERQNRLIDCVAKMF